MTPVAPDAGNESPTHSGGSRRLWLEVVAVLSVTALPSTFAAVSALVFAAGDTLSFTYLNCFLMVNAAGWVLLTSYVVSSSERPAWSFGLGKVRWVSDIAFGIALTVALQFYVVVLYTFVRRSGLPLTWYPPMRPQSVVDWALLPFAALANAAAEELVMRAYLITRLATLLRSKLRAAVALDTNFRRGACLTYLGTEGPPTPTSTGAWFSSEPPANHPVAANGIKDDTVSPSPELARQWRQRRVSPSVVGSRREEGRKGG